MLSQMLKPQKIICFTYDPQVMSEYGPEEFNHLMESVRNVLVEDSISQNIDEEEHKKYIYIILNELKLAESSFKDKINDYNMTPDQNRDQRYQIYMCIGSVCLDLFRLYCKKSKIFDDRGVFTSIPNTSRVRTELATETALLVDVFAIRHAIKKIERLRWRLSDTELPMRFQYREKKIRNWHIWNVMKQGLFVKRMFQKFFSKYGSANPGKLFLDYYKYRMEMFNLLQVKKRKEAAKYSEVVEGTKIPSDEDDEKIIPVEFPDFKHRNDLKRCISEPRLYFGESIFEELDIQLSSVLKKSRSLVAMHFLQTKEGKLSRKINLTEDVEKLAQTDEVEADVAELLEDDLPPVIKSAVQDDKRKLAKAKLQKTIQILEKLQRENRIRDREVKVIDPIFTQPDVVTINYKNKDIARVSSVRVTERGLEVVPTLQIYKPQYNELLGEVPPSIIDQIDQDIDDKKQLQEVYENLKLVFDEYQNKESFDLLEKSEDMFPVPDNLDFGYFINSSTLHQKTRVINEKLVVMEDPPWKGTKRELWELSPQAPRRYQRNVIYPRSPVINLQDDLIDKKKLDDWKAWWSSFINGKDFLKYFSTLKTDFLHTIFHLYDDEKLESFVSIEDKERMTEILKMEEELVKAENKRKLSELRQMKSLYEDGFWNPNTITLGGLGSDPAPLLLKENIYESKISEVDTPTPAGKEISPVIAESSRSPSVTALFVRQTSITQGPFCDDGIAKRISGVWEALEMSDRKRNKMALKYSTNELYPCLSEMLTDWEKVVNLIIEREVVISKLEDFERSASDPNRFFVKVPGGSGALRLREARERSLFYKEIDEYDQKLIPSIKRISKKYNETVTFQDRPYMQKMKYDRVEMLYYLQEERKVNAIHYEASRFGIPLITQYLDMENLPPKILEEEGSILTQVKGETST